MLASAYRGASSPRLRTHPLNLIRLAPAKGVNERSKMLDDCGLRLWRRSRNPGRPEGFRGGRLLRDERDRCVDRAEHARRDRGAGASTRLRRCGARGCLLGHRGRRREDGHALFARADRHRRRLSRGAYGAARRRPGHGRELGREASPGRCRRGARRPVVPTGHRRDSEPDGGRGARRNGHEARARRADPRARRAGGDRHGRPRGGVDRSPVRRGAARRDRGEKARGGGDARRRLHPLRDTRCESGEGPVPCKGRRERGTGRFGGCPERPRGDRRRRGAGGRPRMRTGADLAAIRERKPLVHQITNYVVMNETANATLSLGALPVMAHAREEVEEMAAIAAALVLNIGTLSRPWVEAMLAAGRAANSAGVPVVLDPVGAGATSYRTEAARRLLQEVDVAVVRGNAAEIATLSGREAEIRGVESIGASDSAAALARAAAQELGTVASVTGPVDHVSDGARTIAVANGDALLGTVSGTGCMSSAITGCFLAVASTPLEAAAEALVAFGVA